MNLGQTLSAVLSIIHTMAGLRDRTELMPAIATAMRGIAPADYVACAVFRDDEIEVFADPAVELPSRRRKDYVYGTDPAALLRTMVIKYDGALDGYPEQRALLERLGMHAGCRIPMIVEGRVVGVLIMMTADAAAFDHLDLALVSAMGTAVAIAIDNCLAYEQVRLLRDVAEDTNEHLRAQLAARRPYEGMVGASPRFAAIRKQIEVVAPTEATVLITGESGTGKDVVARAIHAGSQRSGRPLVTVNCAAMPSTLAESELFGHVEGAFTGAHQTRVGRFEAAQSSSLFLDEIGELSLDVQAKLLRVLQQRELERLGSGDTIPLDVRVIAATNRDLAAAVADGTFRADLYYRLSVFPIHVPPLRTRLDDVGALVEYFVDKAAQRYRIAPRKVSPDAMRKLTSYEWPGNVRELQNAIERAMILGHGDELDVSSVVPATVRTPRPVRPDERVEYTAALDACAWVIEGPSGAAAKLQMHPNTLRHRLKRLGIARPR